MRIRLAQSFVSPESKGAEIHFDDTLTENEFQDIQASVSVLQELHDIRYLLGFVQGNEIDLLDYFQVKITEWVAKLKQHIDLEFADINECRLHSNRLFLNYLSSIRTFIDHCETYLNRTFGGRESSEFREFKKMTGALYDASFGYSFFWTLRNYAQHCGLPIGSIGFNWKAEGPNKEGKNIIHYEFTVMFDRDNLLNNYKEWKKVVRTALEQKPQNFDLIPLVAEVTSVINTMERNFEIILNERFLSAAKLLLGYISRIKKDAGNVFVAYDIVTNDSGKVDRYSTLDLLEDTVNEVLAAHKANAL